MFITKSAQLRKNKVKRNERKKCPICKDFFTITMEGRVNYYTTKYCSSKCSKMAIQIHQKEKTSRQTVRLKKRHRELANIRGKVKLVCKGCGIVYTKYVSQVRLRGSSYCSKDCQKKAQLCIPKSKSISRLKKDVWNIFSKYIRLRDAMRTTGEPYSVRCITCNERKDTVNVDAGHFYSRAYTYLLFDEHNVHAQCKRCNMPPHSGEQYLYSKKIQELYGNSELERLTREKQYLKKYKKEELFNLLLDYRARIRKLTKEYGNPWRYKL